MSNTKINTRICHCVNLIMTVPESIMFHQSFFLIVRATHFNILIAKRCAQQTEISCILADTFAVILRY